MTTPTAPPLQLRSFPGTSTLNEVSRYQKLDGAINASMKNLPTSVRPILRRLRRRLAIGLFLETWPRWAVASLLLGGLVTLICRIFFAPASSFLHWLWLAPVFAGFPSIVVCMKRAYRPTEIIALADSLGGGDGALMTLFETGDPRWADAPALKRLSR